MTTKLAIDVVERTYHLEVECLEGQPYRVIARRRQILAKNGKPIMKDGQPIIIEGSERAIEKVIDGSDPEAVQIAELVAGKVDKWAQEG